MNVEGSKARLYEASLGLAIAKDSAGNQFFKNVKLYRLVTNKRWVLSFGSPCEYYLDDLVREYPYEDDLVIDMQGRNHKGYSEVKIPAHVVNDLIQRALALTNRVGIVLAGGSGTRLYPTTRVVSKQLLPVYNKPMVFYPLSVLLQIGIKDVYIISNPEHIESFESLLGDGAQFDVTFTYLTQDEPKGIAHAFQICHRLVEGQNVCLILGDNLFYGGNCIEKFSLAMLNSKSTIFGCRVKNPEAYGVLDLSKRRVVEKPEVPPSYYAVPGIYFFDDSVWEKSLELKPSNRGELEISDLINIYAEEGNLNVQILPDETVWLDMGTPDSLLYASEFVKAIEERTGVQIGDLTSFEG